ncbi:hypothetical protein [Flavobacterium pedocola]
MNAITEIINLLTDAEEKEFILFLKKKNKRHDTKNIKFFNLLKTDDINDEKSWYKNKPALYALRKRLYESLVEFLADKRFETGASEEKEVLKRIVLGRTFFEHSQPKLAFKMLEKAEKMALNLEAFNLLNEIYHTRIQYAYLDTNLPFETLVQQYQINQLKFLQEEKRNLAYASLRIALAKIKEGTEFFDFQQLIQQTIARYDLSLSEILTFKSLYQLLYITNEYAALRNSYFEVAQFVDQSYHFILEKKDLSERHLYYHIHILYFMANLLFRNKRFEEADRYLEKMKVEMQRQSKSYYKEFYLKWVLLKGLTANYSGKAEEALQLVDSVLGTATEKDTPAVLDLLLCQLVFSFQQQDFKKAQQTLKHLHHTDVWYEKKTGMEWAIKKNLVELLLHTELGNTDLVLSRMNSFKRRYKKYLKDLKEERVLVFLKLTENYLFDPQYITSSHFKLQLEQSFTWKTHAEEDLFVMSFYAWLKAKMEKRPVYEVTLELVKAE